MDADRLARYADRWVDFVNGLVIVVVTAILAGTCAGRRCAARRDGRLGASPRRSGRRVAGRSAAASSTARAGFGRSLVSALESVRTVKLAAATPDVHAHLRQVDARPGRGGRPGAPGAGAARRRTRRDGAVRRRRRLGGLLRRAAGSLATALLVANAVNGFDWFGRVAGRWSPRRPAPAPGWRRPAGSPAAAT